MHLPSGPLDTFLNAAGTLWGRLLCFVAVCFIGGAVGYVAHIWHLLFIGEHHVEWSWGSFFLACSVLPAAFWSLLTSWGLITFPVCLIFAFVFARFELPFVTLVFPLVLVAWQIAILRW